jgi:hypothetical protein
MASPTSSPGCVTDPAKLGELEQSDSAPAAAIAINLLLICVSPMQGRLGLTPDRKARAVGVQRRL